MTAAPPANGAPAWLEALGVGKGDYLTETKPRLKRAMKARCLGEAGRVFACLTLHTMAYQQELAVKMHSGKRVPLSPADISEETGINKSNVRRAIRDLEAWGLAKAEGSVKGLVRLYSWAVPKPVDPQMVVARDNQMPIPEGIPPELWRLSKQLKIKLPENLVVSPDNQTEMQSIADDTQTFMKGVRERLLRLSESLAPNRKKETERNIETNERTPADNPPPPEVTPSDPAPVVRSFVPPPPEPTPPITAPPPAPPERTIRERIRALLLSLYDLPMHLSNETLDVIGFHVCDEATLRRFGVMVRGNRTPPESWRLFIALAKNAAAAQKDANEADEVNRASVAEEMRRQMTPYEPYSEETPLAAAPEPEPPPFKHPESPPPGYDPDHEERMRNMRDAQTAQRAAEKAQIEENRKKYRRPLTEGTT